jgi:phenylacetate-CoA ligase
MTSPLLTTIDRRARAAAYDLLVRRDGIHGWKAQRSDFHAMAGMTREEASSRSLDRLRRLLAHAYRTSTYYRRTWDSIGFDPTVQFAIEDLPRLPFLTKDILKSQKADLLSGAFQADDLELSQTGGTTGTQTSFYLDRKCRASRFGRQWGILELCGYRPGMRRALLWGVRDDLPPPGVRRTFTQGLRHYASSDEVLYCGAMNAALLGEYYRRLTRFRPAVIYGYPSALVQLARFVQDERLAPLRASTVIATAEYLSDAARRQLTQAFGAPVFNLYCTREHGCIGFECARHEGFHVDVGSVHLEIINDGRPAERGEAGEIVVTDLLNYGMPFIRSQIKDLGAWSAEPCLCGSPLPLLERLDGRPSDLLYKADGTTMPGLLATDVCHDIPSIRFLQFVQERIGEVDLRLVVTDGFTEEVRLRVLTEVREVLGSGIAINIKLVDDIERSPRSGKAQEVISSVDPRRLGPARAAQAGK